MTTAHKKNHGKRFSASTKRIIGIKSLRQEETITSISQEYNCSRGTVYTQRDKALSAVNQAFEEDDNEVLYYIPITKAFMHQVVLALFLICQSSYRNIIFFLRTIFDYQLSLGGVFNIIDSACEKAQQINQSYDLSPIKTSAADELFHRNKPNLAVVDVESRYCALLAKADNRDHVTWGVHLLDLQKQGYSPDTTIMDSAKGLVKGHEEALPGTVRRHDHFHLIQDLKDCSRYLKNKEASTVTSTLKLLAKAEKSRHSNQEKQYNEALSSAMNELQAIEFIRKQFDLLSHWLQLDVLQLAGHAPETRAILYDFVVAEMTILSKEHPHRLSAIVTSLNNQRNALLDVAVTLSACFEKVAEKYKQPTEVIWHICYAMRYSLDSCKYNNHVLEFEALLGTQYEQIEDEILTILENTHRCSSMIENFNSRLRPYLDEQKSVTQKILSLIQFYLNHKPFMRSCHERLKKKTPAQTMTGKSHPNWLEMLGFTLFQQKIA